jgi:hypothetical protein
VINSEIRRGALVYKEIEASSPEFRRRLRLQEEYLIGDGEAAIIAYCICAKERGENAVVTSNNMRDILNLCNLFDLRKWSVAMQLVHLYESQSISIETAEECWKKMVSAGRRMPVKTFAEAIRNKSVIFI